MNRVNYYLLKVQWVRRQSTIQEWKSGNLNQRNEVMLNFEKR